MGHTPHLLIAGPWTGDTVELSEGQRRHLTKVLRMGNGEPLSYTDGAGIIGDGRLRAGAVVRGTESRVHRDVPELSVAAVPLRDKNRNRFMVEKLSELGVARLQWLRAEYGQAGRPPAKAQEWADQALEQSRGAWRMMVVRAERDDVAPPVIVADPGGGPWPAERPATLVIGPEGGWADSDLEAEWIRVSLGSRILRSETAAIVAAARVLSAKSDSRDQ